LERLTNELRLYAEGLAEARPTHTADDYEEFLRSQFEAMVRHHGEDAIAQMSDETILKVIKSQTRELIQLKRIDKLMRKRDRI
jgi:hypothetical protein